MLVKSVVTAVTNDCIKDACSFVREERNTLEVNGSSHCSELNRLLTSRNGECMPENDVLSACSSLRRCFIVVSTFPILPPHLKGMIDHLILMVSIKMLHITSSKIMQGATTYTATYHRDSVSTSQT